MELKCCYCNKTFKVKKNNRGQRLRSIRLGLPIYCNKKCAGLGRRIDETPEEKRENKMWYDLFIKESMTEDEYWLDYLQRSLYYVMDYEANPEKYRQERKRNQSTHNEYCRQPEYKKWKKGYDEQYRAKKYYGDWWEAAIALKNLDKEIDYRESKRQNKIYNKSTSRRKRKWQNQLKQNIKNLQQLI